MSGEEKRREDEVFGQALSVEDLDAASGGAATAEELDQAREDNCVQIDYRLIYGGGGFPNCAATVEDGSMCHRNDACYSNAVRYADVSRWNDFAKDDLCAKAWR